MTDAAVQAPRAERAGVAPVAAGLAAAGRAVPAALLAALPGLVFLAGYDHLAYGLGVLAGVVLAGQLIAPHIAATGEATITGALRVRFGRPVSVLAGIVIVLAVLPLLAAEFMLVGTLVEGFLGAPYLVAVLAALAIAVLAATTLEDRAFAWLSAAALVLFAASLLAPLGLLAAQDPGTLWPHEAHGAALEQVRVLEEKLIEAGRVDFDTFSTHVTPFAKLERLNVLALVASLALGMAVLPPLISALASPGSGPQRRLAGAWTAFFVMVPLLAVAPLAALAKLAIYTTMTADTPLTSLPAWLEAPLAAGLAHIHGTSVAMLEEAARAVRSGAGDVAAVSDHMTTASLAFEARWLALSAEVQSVIFGAAQSLAADPSGVSAWQLFQSAVVPVAGQAAGNDAAVLTQASLAIEPLGLWLALPALAGAPGILAPLMLAGPVVAALVMATALTRTLLHLGNEASPAAARWLKIVLLVIVVGLAAVAAALTQAADQLVPIVVSSLSLAAGGLFPVLAVGLAWKRATAAATAAAIVLGAGVTLYYDVGIQVFPAAFYETWAPLSNAGEYAVEEFETRLEAWRTAESDHAKVDAQQALDEWARGTPTRRGLANWFGIESSLGAVFGVPLGFAALLVVGFLTSLGARKTK